MGDFHNWIESSTLIRSNQYLMQPEVFPYPFVLIIMHCIFCSVFALFLFVCSPGLYPALTDPDRKVSLTSNTYIREILPISTFFAISLVLSNMAYKYSTVAFLQMIKESNIVNIYFMSVLVGIEHFSLAQISILVVMVLATWGCVKGEMNFSLIGLLVQAGSSTCEAAKTICQSLVLSGPRKLDPLSTVLVVMPVSGLFLGFVLLVNNLLNATFVKQPEFSEIYACRHALVLNIGNAFALNWLIAIFLKYMSPVAYVLTGNVKDICIMLMSAFLMQEDISRAQCLGFMVQIACVFTWSALKQKDSQKPPLEHQRSTSRTSTTSSPPEQSKAEKTS
eukprot:s252_g20.t1